MKYYIKFVTYFGIYFYFFESPCLALCNHKENLDFSKLKTSVVNDSNITVCCKDQLLTYLNGLESKSKWALNMFQSGTIPIRSSNSLGLFDECINLKSSASAKSNITGQYCLVSIAPSNLSYDVFSERHWLGLLRQFATCVPNECQANDTENFLSLLGFKVTVDAKSCQTKGPNFKFTPIIIAATIIFSAIFLGIISCTLYDIFYGVKGNLTQNLSLKTNFRKLVSGGKANQVLCLHGIRGFSTFAIIFYHAQEFVTHSTVANLWYLPEFYATFLGAVGLNSGIIAVQIFFLLSGFLIGYNYINLLERKGQLNVVKYYLHRYFRLTPAISAVILFNVSYLQYLGSGPSWPNNVTQTQVVPCYRQWWMTLLYIQNFSPGRNTYCVPQSWYLTVDMQFYILSPLLLYTIKNWPQYFLSICKTLILGSFLYTLYIVLYVHVQPFCTPEIPNSEGHYIPYIQFRFSVIINAQAWLTGMALSYLVNTSQKKQFVISKMWLTILWTFSVGVIIVSTIFNSIVRSNPTNYDVLQDLYLIFGNICTATSMSWVVFACIFNYAGCVNSFLSWRGFQIISKLSYSMYLVHLCFITVIVGESRYPIVVGNFKILSLFCITVVVTFIFALLLTLFVEWPAMAIIDYFFKRQTSKRSILLPSNGHMNIENN